MSMPSMIEPAPVQSRWFVHAVIALTVGLFIAGTALLGYRWFTTIEPTSMLQVNCPLLLNGATVTVQEVEEGSKQTVVVGEGDRYVVPFWLHPGGYTVGVEFKGQVIFRQTIDLNPNQGMRLDLTKWEPAATRPS